MTNAVITADFDDIDLPEDEQTLFARIPLMAGSSKKAAYLAYRACGFTIGKSAELAGTTRNTIQQWRKSDPVFARWETEELERLQSTVGADIIKFDFLRNMKLLVNLDMIIISKALSDGIDNLSPREYDHYRNIRRMYSAQDWLAIEKIANPEKHQTEQKITINLNWGNRLGETIDAEVKELPEGDSLQQLPAAEYELDL